MLRFKVCYALCGPHVLIRNLFTGARLLSVNYNMGEYNYNLWSHNNVVAGDFKISVNLKAIYIWTLPAIKSEKVIFPCRNKNIPNTKQYINSNISSNINSNIKYHLEEKVTICD